MITALPFATPMGFPEFCYGVEVAGSIGERQILWFRSQEDRKDALRELAECGFNVVKVINPPKASPSRKSRLVLVMENGSIREVISNGPMEIVRIDLEGETIDFNSHSPVVDAGAVDLIMRATNKFWNVEDELIALAAAGVSSDEACRQVGSDCSRQ